MGISYNTSIVRDGLVLHLDAANSKSYPGSGDTWYDLSGNGNDATLTNGPYFVDTVGGEIYFDGVDDYAQSTVPQIQGLEVITVDAVIKWRGNQGKMFLGFDSYDVYTTGGHLGYNNGASNNIGVHSSIASQYIDKFTHYTFVMYNSAHNLTENKIYINGVDQGQLTALVNNDGACRNFGTKISFAIWNNLGGWIGDVEYSNVRLYDRALTQDEVKQNFNALKTRYGL